MPRASRPLIALALLLAAPHVHAQAVGPSVWGGVAPVQLWTVDTVGGTDEAPDVRLQKVARDRQLAAPRDNSADTLRKIVALTRYTPSLTRRQANIARQIARVRAASPASAKSMEEMFREQNVFAMIDGTVAPFGMSTSNVADAYAVWWITTWEASQGLTDTQNDPVAIAAVRKQALLAMVASPRFASLTDAAKQDMADEYVFLTALVTGSMNYLRANPAGLSAYRRGLIETTRAGGLDLSSMRLTRAGFVPAAKR